jgi:hypothetical protein
MCSIQRSRPIRLLQVLLVAGLGLLHSAPLAAQMAKDWTRVRVTAPEHMDQPCIGKVVSAADPFVVREKDGTMHYIPFRQIQVLEVARRRDRSPETYLGMMVGMVVGGVIGYATYQEPSGNGCYWTDPDYPASCPYEPLPAWGRSIVVGLAGAAGGGLVGYMLTPERWRPVWQRPVEVDVGLTPRGPMFRAAVPTR